ncbi:MAG: DUF2934 domain-containing protein [Sulfuritalea sp.]|jgi:hypothetical protein|nr:DUF2934 domain-containing protein [Sulfuritalea sp.]
MKKKSEPITKSKDTGPAKQARSSGKPRSSGNDDCPREQMIAEAAYFHAERRGFAPGNEMSDWLQAETDVTACSG